ncbi:hypothetical protein M9Y10_033945 [Tritrichomonas musculus]|uniref:L-type lectin-like domain-containing protein n=1 Tax=Tritrichomonas musculus TaxID=1915356 RepID=A0ABR2KDI8_9EUKA
MIWLLISISKSLLNRTFIARNNNFSKEWEYLGSASLENSKLNLLKNQLKEFGSSWCTHRLEESNYTLNFLFQIPIGEKASSMFGIWITKSFGLKGPAFGGPLSFKGIGILFQIKQSKLSVEIRQNEDEKLYELSSFSPIFSIIPKSPKLNVVISNDENSNLTIILNVDDQNHTIFSNTNHININKHWLGVTALNYPNASTPLYLETAKIIDSNTKESLVESFPYHQKEKSLNLINQMVSKVQNGNYNPNSSEIVKAIDQLGQTVDFISDEIDLDSIVRKTMIPFSQTWQKRSIKISKQIKTFSEKIKEELDAAEDQFNAFKNDIDKQIYKFYSNLSDIEESLYYTIVSFEFEYNTKLKKQNENLHQGTHVIAITMICVVETFLVALFFISSYQDEHAPKVVYVNRKPRTQPQKKRRKKRKYELP